MQIDWSSQSLTTVELASRLDAVISSQQNVSSLNLNNNQIDDMSPLYVAFVDPAFRNLKILNMSQNLITDVYLTDLPLLITCDFSHNEHLKEPIFVNLKSLKSIDLRSTAITNQFFIQLTSQDVKLRHLRIGGKVSDEGLELAIQKNKLFFENLLTLDLKSSLCHHYTTIQSVQQLLGVRQVKNLPQRLPSVNSSRLSSNSSNRSKSTFSTIELYKQLVVNNTKSIIKKSPAQILIQALLGPNQVMQQFFSGLCELQNGTGVCAVVLAGVKAQPDIEDQLSMGFVRKIGTLFCKDLKLSHIGCEERVRVVCEIMERKIDLQNELVKNDVSTLGNMKNMQGDLLIHGKVFK
ncbi:hypothetical protein SS50377_21109 [Spironucleus salmonicida]|uniref:Leucine rich repeat-containing protein n=1 Tax=Spironucleus salmonicida TaxID=348837 RepID=V6LJJ9_9EUKA|nr:hypothetical protein SS50377_21109 [Spironucleus salmonicida]|eukprot:EST43891.1 Hypothetical protein SS50377_16191 [Spironucleus salmonicida]